MKRIPLSQHIETNQDLSKYLAKNETKYKTPEEFFAKLCYDEELDQENFYIEGLSIRYEDMIYEYKVVFGAHFQKRRFQRLICRRQVKDPIEMVMNQLRIPEVGQYITDLDRTIYWNHKTNQVDGYGLCKAVAIRQDGCPVMCIFEAGLSYIYIRTVLKEKPDMYVYPDTAWVRLSEDGFITQIIPAKAETL